tara:strand:+ start:98 stop:676 length:579 start_codon:yes stop_codon:yes gene_type:complete
MTHPGRAIQRQAARRCSPQRPASDLSTWREVGQGDFVVIDRPGIWLTATLGSCVGIFLHDSAGRQGGMTHIFHCVDPGPMGGGAIVAEIEMLVNVLMRQGARRAGLVARIAGGAHTLTRGKDVGGQIAEVCLDYLMAEAIPLVQADLRGGRARRVVYDPTTGDLQISYPDSNLPPHRDHPSGLHDQTEELFR